MTFAIQSLGDLYRNYRAAASAARSGDESGGAFQAPILSESEFNALPEEQRFQLAAQLNGGQTNVFQDANGNLVGYGDPRFIDQGGWFNPQALTREGNRFTIANSGVNWDQMRGLQDATDRSGFFSGSPLENIIRGMGLVVGAGGLNNFLTSGSIFGDAAAAADFVPAGEGFTPDLWTGAGGSLEGVPIELGGPGAFTPAGEGLTPEMWTGPGGSLAEAGAGASLLDRLAAAGPQLLQSLPGVVRAITGGDQPGGGGPGGGGLGGMGGAAPGGKLAGRVEMEKNPYGKVTQPNVLDLLSYMRGGR